MKEDRNMNESHIMPIALPNGAKIYIRTAEVAAKMQTEGRFGPKEGDISDILNTIEGVCDGLRDTLKKAMPDKSTITFGLELSGGTDGLIALFAKAEAKADITVALEWDSVK